jgi:hypothetical protein
MKHAYAYASTQHGTIAIAARTVPDWQNGRARHAGEAHDGVEGDLRQTCRASISIRHHKVADGQCRRDRGDDQVERRDRELEHFDLWIVVCGARRQQDAVSHVVAQ